jgi:putative SOS response-associated peptidase YedK
VITRWSHVTETTKGPDNPFSMINARAETVDTKPAYRNEWKAEEGKKTPYLIRRADGAPFGMAGLWEIWHSEDGTALESCTILVTDANTLVRAIHDRMPVVFSREDYDAWLAPETKDLDHLKALLRPAQPAPWTLVEVSRKVNSPKNDSPDLLEPVASA